jgi:hypothetical protein
VVLPALTEEKERELMIRDNISNGDWDFDILSKDWDAELLNDWGLEVPLWSAEKGTDGNTDPDAVPDPEPEPVTHIGDLWLMGEHRLLCGDSTDEENVKKVTNVFNVDMIYTDPMYQDDILTTFKPLLECATDHYLIMCTMKQAMKFSFLEQLKFRFDIVLYFKTPSSSMNKKVPYYNHKNIVYLTKKDETIFHCDNAKGVFSESGAGYYPSVIESKKNTQEAHGLTKPAESIKNILSGFKANSVFDPYMGSGTTLIACEQLGRHCAGIELSEQYCDIIIKRWQDFTGRHATLEATGETWEQVKEQRLKAVK